MVNQAVPLKRPAETQLRIYPLAPEVSPHVTLYHGSMLGMRSVIEPESIDAVITDGPYGIGYRGLTWDADICFRSTTWRLCLDVLKPGGYLLAFSSSRTYHRMTCAIEDAGFEIRDSIFWVYLSGFPKSKNIGLAIDKKNGVDNRTGEIGKGTHSDDPDSINHSYGRLYEKRLAQNEWRGWGSCLKPAYEPIVIARKPFQGSLVENVLRHRVGGLNIDECRVLPEEGYTGQGRFPANIIHDGSEEACAGFPITPPARSSSNISKRNDTRGSGLGLKQKVPIALEDSGGSAARYFYCAKASSRDRDEGLDSFGTQTSAELTMRKEGSVGISPYVGSCAPKKNFHPTVKPMMLMQYLIRLVAPKGAVILDPFMGSGSTGKAAMFENVDRDARYRFIGIELKEEYLPIAAARISYALSQQKA